MVWDILALLLPLEFTGESVIGGVGMGVSVSDDIITVVFGVEEFVTVKDVNK